MATANKVIDLERSYVPMDPKSFPESMHGTGREDAPEDRIPVILYDGYNFIPTQYGYSSYFGVNSKLEIDELESNVDDLFIVQTNVLNNILVALCEDGIWTKDSSTTGAWTHIIDLDEPDPGSHLIWTRCVISNNIYMYRDGNDDAYRMNAGNLFVPTAFTPTFLNMEGQKGIFKAGGRLGFWDDDDSIAWSNADDHADFEPSLATGAGNAKFQQVMGKIANVSQHGNGFIIYATKSITVVARGADANFFWISGEVFNNNGISYYNQAVIGQPDTIHFAYTTFGFVKIENGKPDYVLSEVFSYLKEKKEPVYLRILEGRYLFLEILSADLIYPEVTFSHGLVEGTTITWPGASYSVENVDNIYNAWNGGNNQEGLYLYNNHGFKSKKQATTPGIVPIWNDHLSSAIDLGTIEEWKNYNPSLFGSEQYFRTSTYENGGITKVDGSGEEYFIPATDMNIPLVASYSELETVEANNGNFFLKQEMVFFAETKFTEDWIYAVVHKQHNPIVQITTEDPGASTQTKHTFGPYLDLTNSSERNRYYGVSDSEKSAWLQRSLTKGINIIVYETKTVETLVDVTVNDEYEYYQAIAPYLIHTGTAATWPENAVSGWDGSHQGAWDLLNIAGGNPDPLTVNDGTGNFNAYCASTGGFGTPVTTSFTTSGAPPGHTIAYVERITCSGGFNLETYGQTYINNTTGNFVAVQPTGVSFPLDITIYKVTQKFSIPTVEYVDYETCVYQELGFTKITGHGHYDLLGAFIVDDDTDEDADYSDICAPTDGPTKKKTPEFNGVNFNPNASGMIGGPQSVTIGGETYTYADQTITLPPGTFLLQDGSIEPIYPTFQGAFVYDLQYKKWGKMGQSYKMLLDYSPINSEAGDNKIPFEIFGVFAGALLTDGSIALFDKFPTDCIMRFGKIGYYRQGFTDCEEIILQFRNQSTGVISLEGSLDGKNIEPALTQSKVFEDVNEFRVGFTASARWSNITLSGTLDLKHMEFKGHKKGKR